MKEEFGTVHCVMMGDERVGKTSISECYEQETFIETYEETMFDNRALRLNVAGENFSVNLFDVSSKESYENLRTFAYQKSEVILLCFSAKSRSSFDSIKNTWMPELKRHTKVTKQKRPIILVGTQADLDCEISSDEGHQLAKDIGADCYVECSAREQKGLKDVFMHVVFSALKYKKKKTSILKQFFRRSSGYYRNC